MAGIGSAIPWWGKIAAKIVLRRLPVSGRTWQRLNLFSPGFMLDPDYALGVFSQHFTRAGSPSPGFTYLELGPGDSLATAPIAWAYGASGGYLVDNGAYAAEDIKLYQPLFARLAGMFREPGAMAPVRDAALLQDCQNIDDMLQRTGAVYRKDGLSGLRLIPSQSINMIFSHAVLEHVPLAEFPATALAMYNVLKPDGSASHKIDFKDHLGSSLHNLRFSEAVWERPWFASNSGFYTNRLRFSQMMDIFRSAGFDVFINEQDRWPELPLPRTRMDRAFCNLPDDDLLTRDALVVMRRKRAVAD